MNDVVINKAAIIENCIKRIHEEYDGHEEELENNFTKQDAIVLNLQRACEAAIDIGTHIIRSKRLDIPQTMRDVFVILEKNKIIPAELSKKLQAMIGFRNIAIHDYRTINLAIVKSIIRHNLADFIEFKKLVLKNAVEM
jgi:uncharacterized protein YutE (UPF0331/DUF86 family)